MTPTQSIIAARVNPALHHRIEPAAMLSDLDICPIDLRFSIPVDLEMEFGLAEFSDAEIGAWSTVGCVEQSVAGAIGRVG